jgi:hypothetical protein
MVLLLHPTFRAVEAVDLDVRGHLKRTLGNAAHRRPLTS